MTTSPIWQEALDHLKHQLPKETFEKLLMRTTARQVKGTLIVNVPNTFALEWIEHRLRPKIEHAVHFAAGHPLQVEFQLDPTRLPPPANPAPQAGQISIELIEFDPTRKGFVMTPHYAIRFWQPYLGLRPFALWQTLRSFASNPRHDATPSIQTLADIVAGGNRHAILGRNPCNGRKRQVGALQVLEDERIVWVRAAGSGRAVRYQFRVLDTLPLLTPVQVRRLTPRLQEAHHRWIRRCNIDYEEWQQLTLPTLCKELMSGT